MKITLTGKQLRAALHNAATKDIRYYLNGLFFDLDTNKLVATNGHHMYLSTIYCESEENDVNGIESFILPRFKVAASVIKAIITYTGYKNIQVELMYKDGNATVQCFEAIDGTFPNYERVMPSGVNSVTESFFNASYMALIEKTYGKNAAIRLEFYGDNVSMLVTCKGDNAQLVIMPMRKENFYND